MYVVNIGGRRTNSNPQFGNGTECPDLIGLGRVWVGTSLKFLLRGSVYPTVDMKI